VVNERKRAIFTPGYASFNIFNGLAVCFGMTPERDDAWNARHQGKRFCGTTTGWRRRNDERGQGSGQLQFLIVTV
jgi:hypothetical protein